MEKPITIHITVDEGLTLFDLIMGTPESHEKLRSVSQQLGDAIDIDVEDLSRGLSRGGQ